jgi:hypothetical protein
MEVHYIDVSCGQRYMSQFQMRYDFEDGGHMRAEGSAGTQTLLSNTCPHSPREHCYPGAFPGRHLVEGQPIGGDLIQRNVQSSLTRQIYLIFASGVMRIIGFVRTGAFLIGAILCVASHPAHALDQDDLENLSRHGEASAEAFVRFGNVGETLTRISSSKFGGIGLTGSQRREMSRRVEAAMQPWRDASAAAKGGLSYKVLPHAFTLADEGMAMIGQLAELDLRGATGTAVSVAVEPATVGTFTAIGTGAGAMLGSFVPVVGNALGGVVGGAVGTVVGGYISAYAYDKYVKELVARAVEGGVAAVFDTSPLQQAMQARQAFLHRNAPPEVKAEWDRMNAVSRSFGGGEGQVLDWERLPYVIERKPAEPPPSATSPTPEQQAALTTGNVLAGVRKFKIGDEVWEIRDGFAAYRVERNQGDVRQVETAHGSVSINLIKGTITRHYEVSGIRGCQSIFRETIPFVFAFSAENVSGELKAGPVEVLSDSCGRGWAKATEPRKFTYPWQRIE